MDDLTSRLPLSPGDFLESLKNSTTWRCNEDEVNTGQRLKKKFEAQNKCVQLPTHYNELFWDSVPDIKFVIMGCI